MVKEMQFNRPYTMEVKKEKISGIILDMTTSKTDDTLAPISNLNKIGIDIKVTRKGGSAVYMHQGFLDDLLVGLFSQTPRLEIIKKPFGIGYNMFIEFSGVLELRDGDLLEVVINANSSAFTGLSTQKSEIIVETVPSTQEPTLLPIIKVKNIGNGNTTIEEQLQDNMVKLVLATDFTTTYDASNKAKMQSMELTGLLDNVVDGTRENYSKAVSHNLLIAQNRNMFGQNPESEIENLVLYLSENMLDNVKIRAKLDAPADADAKLISVHYDVY